MLEELIPQTKLTEGKTKIIWETTDPTLVIIESKDDITAGDGLKRDVIPGKGVVANETTVNCFEFLEAIGLPTHFVRAHSDSSFVAQRAEMFPFESVARRSVAIGSSYLLRHPEAYPGMIFERLETELYIKNDELHDPLVIPRGSDRLDFFNPKVPQNGGFLFSESMSTLGLSPEIIEEIKHLTIGAFEALEFVFSEQGVLLEDLKVEFGKLPGKGVLLCDVVDNDSWRLKLVNEPGVILDKQAYRNIKRQASPEELQEMLDKYKRVAKMTRRFML